MPLSSLLRPQTPLLRTLLPTLALAYGIQTGVAIPSIYYKTERFYDLSGSLTYLSCTALSLALPFWRARSLGQVAGIAEYLGRVGGNGAGVAGGNWWWRQALLSVAVGVWAGRLGTYLYRRIASDNNEDSRFDSIRGSPSKFYVAFFAQATWVSLCLLPVISVNALPRSAFALAGSQVRNLASSAGAAGLATKPYLTDVLGLGLFVFGLTFEIVADRQKSQWVKEKKEKKHSEEFLTHGLWSRSRHPNYFGEVTLWTGIAVAAAGLLVRHPAQVGLGLEKWGFGGKAAVVAMCAASPGFVTFLLTKVSGIPLSENKYDGKFGRVKEYREWKERTPVFFPKVW
ncbi:hypothetical protein B0J11DRAFT_163217 [Dendryphion nanum]|uniref:Steroid 5-alpha reductase C-terminal domain-containing protein n=1 Tax=Dendryphion nanum TaxID=256645 RepID=A0A9P9IU64_9PLEO|nr:hypothetical protein B0J11DRAFT_163217 [Dendryphion nanum]